MPSLRILVFTFSSSLLRVLYLYVDKVISPESNPENKTTHTFGENIQSGLLAAISDKWSNQDTMATNRRLEQFLSNVSCIAIER